MMKRIKYPRIIQDFKYSPFPPLKLISFFLIFQIFTIPFIEASLNNQGSFLTWLLVGGTVTLVVIGILYLYKAFCEKRYGGEVPISRLCLGGLLLGTFKGGSTQYLVNFFSVQDLAPWDDITARAFSGGFLGLLIAFFMSLYATYSKEVNLLSQRLMGGDRSLVEGIAFLGNQIDELKKMTKDELITSIIEELSPGKEIELSTIDVEQNWKIISETLREKVAKKVRSESHELGHLNLNQLNIKNQFLQSFARRSFNIHPLPFGFLYFAISFGPVSQDWNTNSSLPQLAVNTTITIFVLGFTQRVLQTGSNVSKTVNYLYCLGPLFLNCIFFVLIADFFESTFSLSGIIIVFTFQLFLFLCISIFSDFIQSVNKLGELDSEIRQDLLNKHRILTDFYDTMRLEISRHLHGYLVVRTMSTAHLLENFAKEGDFEAYKHELHHWLDEFTYEGLQKSLDKVFLNAEYISFIQSSWAGLIDVEIKIPEDLEQRLVVTQRVEAAHVVDELISNAHRHGLATRISITVDWSDDGDLEIEAIDDGSGFDSTSLDSTGGQGGFGSQLFESASGSRWERRNAPGQGAAVRLTLTPHKAISKVIYKP